MTSGDLDTFIHLPWTKKTNFYNNMALFFKAAKLGSGYLYRDGGYIGEWEKLIK